MCMKCDPSYSVHSIGFPDTGNVNAYMLCHPIMQLKITSYGDCIIIGSSLSLACMHAYTLYAYCLLLYAFVVVYPTLCIAMYV